MGRINQLTPTTTLTANSVIAMDAESGGATNKVTIQTLASGLRSFGNYATQADLNAKQDVLTFDDSPEEDSDNPVTSGGIYNAIGSAMSNVYTKAETDNAIAQSTAAMLLLEKHDITVSGFDGTQKESSLTIPLKSGYNATVVHMNPSAYSATRYIAFWGAVNQSTGLVYFEHNLAASVTKITVTVIYNRVST